MRVKPLALGLIGPLCLAACASAGGPETPSGPATVVAAPGEPAPARARFYADCIAAAASAGTFEKEPGENFLRFHCTGAPARDFYDGLADWSARIGSETVAEGRTWRFTQKLQRDPVGVDSCSSDGAGDYGCTVILNVGEFLTGD